MVKVKIDETCTRIDPFNIRYYKDHYQVFKDDTWVDAEFVDFCYYCPEKDKEFYDHQVRSGQIERVRFAHLADGQWELDNFPSILIVCVPSFDTQLHNRLKILTNYYGIQSQFANMERQNQQNTQ